MSKLFVILLSAVIVAISTGRVRPKENGENPVLSLMMSLRAEVEKLASRVDGISSHLGQLTPKVEKLEKLESKVENNSVDMTSVKKSLTADPFSSCTGEIITVPGTTIKYPLSGAYSTNKNCHWTVNAGKNVTVFFTKFDVATDGGCWVEITQNGRRVKRWAAHSVPTDVLHLNGEFNVKFISGGYRWSYTGFQMEIR